MLIKWLLVIGLMASQCSCAREVIDLDGFMDRCEKVGHVVKKSRDHTSKGCSLELTSSSDLNSIPKSGSLDIDFVFQEATIDASTIKQITKGREIASFEFKQCHLNPSAIEAIRDTRLHGLFFNNSDVLIDDVQQPDVLRRGTCYEMEINKCDPRLADYIIKRIGLASRTVIDMGESYQVTLGDEEKHVHQLVIQGCNLSVQQDFVSSSMLLELHIYGTRLSASGISSILRLKDLCVLSIFNYKIEDSEWNRFDLPKKFQETLVILTTGKLLDFFSEHLDVKVSLPGRNQEK